MGRPLNRSILDANDQVVAASGTVITHALIEAARQRGVLDALLGSVERASIVSPATSSGAGEPKQP